MAIKSAIRGSVRSVLRGALEDKWGGAREVVDLTGSKLLLEGGTDAILLEGDAQSGTDVLLLEGTN